MRDPETPNIGGEESHNLENKNENYPSAGNARNICFSWPDGRRVFLNYAYLISGEFDSINNLITLQFTTHEASIKGIGLNELFGLLLQHKIQKIAIVDKRYSNLEVETDFAVHDVTIIVK